MLLVFCLAAALLLAPPSYGQTPGQTPPVRETCTPEDSDCRPPSKSEIKKAHKLYEKAEKSQHEGKFQQAIRDLDQANTLAPTAESVSLREMIRQQLITTHIDRGNIFLKQDEKVEAMAEFAQAIALDPKSNFALQRIQDLLPSYTQPQYASAPLSHALTVVSNSQPTVLRPSSAHHEFHCKGMSRNLLEQVAAAYGIKPMFDDSVRGRPVKLELESVDFFTALREAAKLAHVFWVPVAPDQIFFADDTQALRRQYEHMIARTFYINNATAPQDVNDVVNLMRTIFDIRFVVAQPSDNSVVVRAPAEVLDAAAQVVETFLDRKPQVNLQVQIFQVSHRLTRQIGVSLPLSFQAINVGAAALAGLGQGGGNLQDIINQLISSGGINNVDPNALQALIAQLQGQQNSQINQLLQTPFATFGGGKTLFAVPFTGTTANFSVNKSDFQTLSDLTMRTAQNNAATLRLGSRYPILNASFSPVYNSSAISQVLANNSYTAPFPSFTYEDLGITVKATPQVLGDNSVNLKLEVSIKSLTGQSFNNVPVISNREYTATVSVLDGESAAVAGMITEAEQNSLSGIPGLGHVPIAKYATTNDTKDVTRDEVLLVITPHIVSAPRRPSSSDEVWLTGN
jgi:general secretion pathway protein D